MLKQELDDVIATGCADVQFDEPMYEAPRRTEWAGDILNELIEIPCQDRSDQIPGLRRRSAARASLLHQYTDLAPAFRK